MKTCTTCSIPKKWDEFYKSKRHKDGYSPRCKQCESDRHRTPEYVASRKSRYQKNRIKHIAGVKASRKKHWPKHQIKLKEYYQKNKPKWIEAGWKQKGISDKHGRPFTLEDYIHVLESQGGVCAICKSDGKSHKKGLVVDHDHKTGVYRGILCAFCNTALSYFKDNPDILTKAINYLK